MRLGTYTTVDCPTVKLTDEALAWLKVEFEKIDGTVRGVFNEHDFGMYPSFEVDYPEELELVDDDPYLEEGEEVSEEDRVSIDKKDDWHEKANKIIDDYHKKFCD
jgi:hypothetical protein